ncbi:hypothetical protein DW657_10085 [Prevotella sp. AM23-5]|uniref:hypothetical protein n=1 Tax=Prevotellaceae TaxID=171552 RepID=UPI000E4EE77E|nr:MULTISPECIES: hypothetical protein [Prevotellaceae]RHN93147.1 hypothetical protein DW657_10085 [Prevotella sp. AM23-5]
MTEAFLQIGKKEGKNRQNVRKTPKNTQWARYSHPRIAMPETSKAEASSKAESPEELKPDNKK